VSRFTSFILLSSACPSSSSCSSVLLHGPSSCTAILSPVVSPPSPSQTFYGRKTAVSLDKPNPNLNTAPPPAVNCRPVWRQRPHHHAPLPTQSPTLPPSSPPFGITPTTTPSHSDFTLGSARRRKEVVDRAEAPRSRDLATGRFMSRKISFLTHVGGSTAKTGPRGRPRNATAFLERPWFKAKQFPFHFYRSIHFLRAIQATTKHF
jgi:hypothetical protein